MIKYSDLMATGKISFHIALEPVTLYGIQRLFEELYLCAQFNPECLFVSGQDHDTLSTEIARATNVCYRGINPPDAIALYGVTKIINQTSGKLVDLVIMPSLSTGEVIVGFFR